LQLSLPHVLYRHARHHRRTLMITDQIDAHRGI
jgi:hypothetical protein